jgi:hypothetical protein
MTAMVSEAAGMIVVVLGGGGKALFQPPLWAERHSLGWAFTSGRLARRAARVCDVTRAQRERSDGRGA